MPVLDASTIIAAVSPGEAVADARRILEEALRTGASAPSLLIYECANVLQVKHRRSLFDEATRDELLDIVVSLPITYHAPRQSDFGRRIVPMAARLGLSVYDASYLDLALRNGEALASADRRLREAASNEGVALL
jgi:predicted nucleic acid-binding protein